MRRCHPLRSRAPGQGGPGEETRVSSEELQAWSARSTKKREGVTNSRWAKVREGAAKRAASGEWDGASPMEMVAAYALLHEHVYGVAPGELDPKSRMYAAGAAARMLTGEFGGEPAEMAEFLRWTWDREAKREKDRRHNGRDGGRIGWRLQFGGAILTDYRVSRNRRRT